MTLSMIIGIRYGINFIIYWYYYCCCCYYYYYYLIGKGFPEHLLMMAMLIKLLQLRWPRSFVCLFVVESITTFFVCLL